MRGYQHDRRLRVPVTGTQHLYDVETTLCAQVDVDDNQLRRNRVGNHHCVRGRRGRPDDCGTGLEQHRLRSSAEGSTVVDDQAARIREEHGIETVRRQDRWHSRYPENQTSIVVTTVPFHERLIRRVLRPSTPAGTWGVVLSLCLIAVEVTVVLQLKQIAPENSFGAVFMFGVLIVSAGWGFRISIATSVASAAAYAYIHASEDSISLVPAVLVFTVLALVTNVLVGQSRLRAVESEQRRQEADLLARLARSMLMTSDIRKMLDDAGERLTSELDLPRPHTCIVLGPAPSLDADREAIALTDGPTVIGALLVPRGLQAADTRRVRRIVPALESLLTAALQAQETRHELTRSRARVVAASDHARRTIERDLHDGAQQHIVSLGLQLRSVQAAVPEQLPELRQRVDGSIETLTRIHEDLRELSRGIHPAILTRGGLAPALKTLARRSSIPVSLNTDIPARLPDAIEVAAYYVVAEALTNAAKYSGATEVTISAESTTAVFDLIVSDDGCGGADFTSGSGLIGLRDRVAAVGGTLTLRSTPDSGTTLTVRIAGRPPSPPRGRAEGHDGFARVRGEGQ